PLSSAVAMDPAATIRIEHPRFARMNAPVRVLLHAMPAQAGPLEVRVETAYLDAFRVEAISPPAEATRIGPDWTTLVFDAAGPGWIRFDLEPTSSGYIQGR